MHVSHFMYVQSQPNHTVHITQHHTCAGALELSPIKWGHCIFFVCVCWSENNHCHTISVITAPGRPVYVWGSHARSCDRKRLTTTSSTARLLTHNHTHTHISRPSDQSNAYTWHITFESFAIMRQHTIKIDVRVVFCVHERARVRMRMGFVSWGTKANAKRYSWNHLRACVRAHTQMRHVTVFGAVLTDNSTNNNKKHNKTVLKLCADKPIGPWAPDYVNTQTQNAVN